MAVWKERKLSARGAAEQSCPFRWSTSSPAVQRTRRPHGICKCFPLQATSSEMRPLRKPHFWHIRHSHHSSPDRRTPYCFSNKSVSATNEEIPRPLGHRAIAALPFDDPIKHHDLLKFSEYALHYRAKVLRVLTTGASVYPINFRLEPMLGCREESLNKGFPD